MYANAYSWFEDPNPHPLKLEGLFFDSFEEAEQEGNRLTRESFDTGYAVIDLGENVKALRLACQIVGEVTGPSGPDDDEPGNLIKRLQDAVEEIWAVAAIYEERGLE